MNDRVELRRGDVPQLRTRVVTYKKDFWAKENLNFSTPHFRMRKVARVVRRLARGRECDLLDVGCGPGALGTVLPPNLHYYGIDISIPVPAQNFLEMDILETPIGFHGRRFDFVVAQGMFEYVGDYQSEKFAEIATILKPDGRFVLTYTNFNHRQPEMYYAHSNVQRLADFRDDLSRFFRIERCFPASYNWRHRIPGRRLLTLPQAHLNVNIPLIGPLLAVDYLYVCSRFPTASHRGTASC
jgi:SAM-dependent methyltransferase